MNTWKTLPTFFQKKRDLLMQYLDQSPFQVKASAGTYFQLVDYSEISQQVDTEYAMELIKSIGVATIPVSVFYDQAPKQQLLRICFAKTDELLHQAGERIISLDN
jgi:methionine aminotransferase